MSGIDVYNNDYQRKINNIIKENSKLQGFYHYLGNSSISTVHNYLLHINNFLQYIGDVSLEQLSIDEFSGFMMKNQKNKKGQESTSSYKIVVYSALKKYGKYLVAAGKLDRNPMDFIDRPRPTESQYTKQKREKGYLTDTEITEYIETVKSGVGSKRSKSFQNQWKERDLAIVLLFLNTGIRCSALMKIDITDLDFEKSALIVTDKESEVMYYELSEELMDVLYKWIIKRNTLVDNSETALFVSNRRKRMSQHSISTIVNKYAKNITGKHITPHKLRATYGTQLYNATNDIYFVQQCMNHQNPKTTELYIRGNQNQTKKASDIMKKFTIK